MSTSYMAKPPGDFDTHHEDLEKRLVELAIEHTGWKRGKSMPDGDLALIGDGEHEWAHDISMASTPDNQVWLTFSRYGMGNLEGFVGVLRFRGWKVISDDFDGQDEWDQLHEEWYPMQESVDDKEVAKQLRLRRIPVKPCGLNADWCVSAWHLGEGKPNVTDGDLYLLDTEEDNEFEVVQRFYTADDPKGDGNDIIKTVIKAGPLEEVLDKLMRKEFDK